MHVRPSAIVTVLALWTLPATGVASDTVRPVGPRPPRNAAAAARGYLAALRSEEGWRICPLVTDATKRAFIDQARNEGVRVHSCVAAADHDFHRLGRVLGNFRVIRVTVHNRVAYATVNDAAISDSGNDIFRLLKARSGRWLVDDS